MLKRFNTRLRNRLIVAFIFASLIPTAIIGIYSNGAIRAALIAHYRTQQLNVLTTRANVIEAALQDAENKLNILNGDQTIQNYKTVLEGTPDSEKTDAVQAYFSNVLKNSPGFKDIRIIDSTGQEVVRVDNSTGNPRIITGSELENKATRSYFTETIAMPNGLIYDSGLDLNVDQGKIDQPYLPVIRYATPLYGSNRTILGIVVLKLFAVPILAQATAGGESGSHFYVINADGSYWWNDDSSQLYGNILGTDASFKKDYPETADYIKTSHVDDGFVPDNNAKPDTFQFFNNIAPSGQDHTHWLIYYEIPQSNLFVELNNILLGIASIAIVTLMISVIGALIFTQTIAQPIRGLSQAMIKLGQRQWDTPIPQNNRNDEIGQLTDAARQMAQDINLAYNNLQKQADELKVANALVKESARLKSEFMATMSHELRTPLNAMLGFSSILLEGMGGEIDADAEHMIQRIQANSERLLTLINGVLDIAKIEAGRLEMVEQPVEIRQLVAGWNAQVGTLARQKNLAFDIDIDPSLPRIIKTDSERLSQIAINLLSNAFKFTETGSVRLSIRALGDQLQIDVMDTGIGIPPHALNFIFEEFRQLDGSTQRAYGGTGLGLAIVRNLCRMMNGSVHVHSEQGKGSTFTVTLPLIPITESVVLV